LIYSQAERLRERKLKVFWSLLNKVWNSLRSHAWLILSFARTSEN
jgi:hypothetical protein